MVWIKVVDSNEIISFEKIEEFNWTYPNSAIIEINAKISSKNYKICSARIISKIEEHSDCNSLITVISQDGFSYTEIHIDKIRLKKLNEIFAYIFATISNSEKEEIINLNKNFEYD